MFRTLALPRSLCWALVGVVLSSGIILHGQTVTENLLYRFSGGSDGAYPSGLILASDGNFYGMTQSGGNASVCVINGGCGTIFQVTPYGQFKTLHAFSGEDGQGSSTNMIEGSDQYIYGVTNSFESSPTSIFKISSSGDYEALVSSTSFGTISNLIQASDGNIYGTTTGTTSSEGTVFRLTLSGVMTTVFTFAGGTTGAGPSGLLELSPLAFNGVTSQGGTSSYCSGGCGTFYQVTSSGQFQTLATFVGPSGDDLHFIINPTGPLTFYGSYLYGLGTEGSSSDCATTCQFLTGFFSGGGIVNDTFGPNLPLTVGGDDNLYLVVGDEIYTLAGNTVFTFGQYGYDPVAPIVQSRDGSFYGATSLGADVANSYCCGTIYQLVSNPAIPPPIALSLSPQSVSAGETATISWSVIGATPTTMQQCYAVTQNNPAGSGSAGWSGIQIGTLKDGTYSGSAQVTPSSSGVYTYALTCGGVESGFASLQVGGAKAMSVTQLTSTAPVTLGSSVTLTAMVTTLQNIAPFSGTVSFSSGDVNLGTVTLGSNGSASLNLTATGIPAGTYPVTATYSGDTNYLASSITQNVVVLGYATSATLSTSTSTLAQGQSVTLTSKVQRTSVSGTPTGTVTFYDGTLSLGSAKLVNGVATLTEATNGSIPPGTYAITSVYSGDSEDQAATSSAVDVKVVAATGVTLTASPNPAPVDSSIALTARVKEKYGSAAPTGTVTFSIGSTELSMETLNGSGTAAINQSDTGYAAGTYAVTAAYSGDGSNAPSTGTVNVVVQ